MMTDVILAFRNFKFGMFPTYIIPALFLQPNDNKIQRLWINNWDKIRVIRWTQILGGFRSSQSNCCCWVGQQFAYTWGCRRLSTALCLKSALWICLTSLISFYTALTVHWLAMSVTLRGKYRQLWDKKQQLSQSFLNHKVEIKIRRVSALYSNKYIQHRNVLGTSKRLFVLQLSEGAK